MAISALDVTEKESRTRVSFFVGIPSNPTIHLYTDWPEAIPGIAGQDFKPVQMKIEYPKNTGVLDVQPCRITLPFDDFTTRISDGLPHPAVSVFIEEENFALDEGTGGRSIIQFWGQCIEGTQNRSGESDLVTISAVSFKALTDSPIGIVLGHLCPWALFGTGCGLLRSNERRTATIETVSGTEITTTDAAVTDPEGPGGVPLDDLFWHRGYLEERSTGLRIMIRWWDATKDRNTFYLSRHPPTHWLGLEVDWYPGCDKSVEICRLRWDNEANIGNIGYKMPDHHPQIESGTAE